MCTKWEKLRELKNNERVDKVSVQKLRENHETILQLVSQLQQMQEQMNSMIDSGDFQDVESNYSGGLSHVSSQPAMIPSSRSLLSRDKRLPFLRGRQIAYLIYDYFRVTGAHDTVLDYGDSFTVTLRNDNVLEVDTRWDEILLSMT